MGTLLTQTIMYAQKLSTAQESKGTILAISQSLIHQLNYLASGFARNLVQNFKF